MPSDCNSHCWLVVFASVPTLMGASFAVEFTVSTLLVLPAMLM